jgi:hypothetical protein
MAFAIMVGLLSGDGDSVGGAHRCFKRSGGGVVCLRRLTPMSVESTSTHPSHRRTSCRAREAAEMAALSGECGEKIAINRRFSMRGAQNS